MTVRAKTTASLSELAPVGATPEADPVVSTAPVVAAPVHQQRDAAIAATQKDREAHAQARPAAGGRTLPQLAVAQAAGQKAPSTATRDNIGWLWRDGSAERGPDQTDQFMHRYLRASGGADILPPEAKDYVYLWLPGLINKHVPGDLYESTRLLEAQGLTVRDLPLSGQTSLDANAEVVRQAILDAAAEGKKCVLVGYSWGANAGLDALAKYPELAKNVVAVSTQDAPYAGNAMINEMRSSHFGGAIGAAFQKLTDVIPEALDDMTYGARQRFIAAHPYPTEVPTVAFVGNNTDTASSLFGPSATYLRKRYGAKSDGMVAIDDSSPPGAARVIMQGVDHMGSVTKKPALAAAASPALTTLTLVSMALERAKQANTSFLAVAADEMKAYEAQNGAIAKKYPTLTRAFSDPDAFVADVKGRFEQQKVVTPLDPYAFDFSDYALPIVAQMRAAIAREIDQVQGHDQEQETGRGYLRALASELGDAETSGKMSYRRLLELGYFASRALGHFDMPGIKLRDRALLNLDRYQLGYLRTDIRNEFHRYQAGDFTVFDRTSPVASLQRVAKDFADAVFDPNEMRMVCLPTMESLETAPFMRLLSQDIYLLGVGADPIPADGFVRPGGDFWNHDMRHSASIYVKKKEYERRHSLSPAQINKLQKRSDRWRGELDRAVARIPDANLRHGVEFFLFNYHHDRGIPMLPSSYTPPERPGNVALLLYAMLEISNQPVDFDRPIQTLQEAWNWLEDFWIPRARDEQAIWQAKR